MLFSQNHLISALQATICLNTTVFVQDGTLPHIGAPIKQPLQFYQDIVNAQNL